MARRAPALPLLLVLAPLVALAFGGALALGGAPVVQRLGVETFEPTLGLTSDGTIYFSTTPVSGVAIGFGTGVHKSTDGGATWQDVSPRVAGVRMPPETNDPYVYVDESTGRVYQFAMAPILVCTIMSWSDDAGATWTTNPRGCGTAPPYDHQTLVAAKPRLLPTYGYPNVLVQCVKMVAGGTHCSRSLDGGITWEPAGLPATLNCSGLTGHLVSAPDGTLYIPKDSCGTFNVYRSTNDGTNWIPSSVSLTVGAISGPDPSVAVDSNGVVYGAFTGTDGRARVAVSKNAGVTWSTPLIVSPAGVTTNLVTITARGPGQVALAYAGTEDLPNGYGSTAAQLDAARWNAYVTTSVNADQTTPSYATQRATDPSDPIVRGRCGPGRCPGLVDFIDVVIGPDGKAYAAFVDACKTECVAGTKGNNASEAFIVVS